MSDEKKDFFREHAEDKKKTKQILVDGIPLDYSIGATPVKTDVLINKQEEIKK